MHRGNYKSMREIHATEKELTEARKIINMMALENNALRNKLTTATLRREFGRRMAKRISRLNNREARDACLCGYMDMR